MVQPIPNFTKGYSTVFKETEDKTLNPSPLSKLFKLCRGGLEKSYDILKNTPKKLAQGMFQIFMEVKAYEIFGAYSGL